jgi:hypothetical protein
MFSGVTRCFRYAVGDLIAQSFETDDGADPLAPKKGYNWERAAVFMAFGTFLAGPVYATLLPAAACCCLPLRPDACIFAHPLAQIHDLVR